MLRSLLCENQKAVKKNHNGFSLTAKEVYTEEYLAILAQSLVN